MHQNHSLTLGSISTTNENTEINAYHELTNQSKKSNQNVRPHPLDLDTAYIYINR